MWYAVMHRWYRWSFIKWSFKTWSALLSGSCFWLECSDDFPIRAYKKLFQEDFETYNGVSRKPYKLHYNIIIVITKYEYHSCLIKLFQKYSSNTNQKATALTSLFLPFKSIRESKGIQIAGIINQKQKTISWIKYITSYDHCEISTSKSPLENILKILFALH